MDRYTEKDFNKDCEMFEKDSDLSITIKNKRKCFGLSKKELLILISVICIAACLVGVTIYFAYQMKIEPLHFKINEQTERVIHVKDNLVVYYIKQLETNISVFDDLNTLIRILKLENGENAYCFVSQAFGAKHHISEYNQTSNDYFTPELNKNPEMVFRMHPRNIVDRNFLNKRCQETCHGLPLFWLRQINQDVIREKRDYETYHSSVSINLGIISFTFEYLKTFEGIEKKAESWKTSFKNYLNL